jgi:acid phosphatase (class A)
MTRTPTRIVTTGLVALAVFAGAAAAQNRAPRHGIFVTPDQLDAAAILPAPPADGSPRAKQELAEVHRLQDSRQAAQIAHVKADDEEEDMFIFRGVLGEKFNAQVLPRTAVLSGHLHNDESVIGSLAKQKFQKLRPFNFDATVKPVCKVNGNPNDYGYPSGHSLTGYLEALALVQMVPEKRDAIITRADDYAYSRVVCGVHYRSDTEASKSLSYAMMALMMNNGQFRRELDAARAETRQALGLRPIHSLMALTAVEIDPSRLLPAPPPEGSPAQEREMTEVKRLVANRTPERFASAKWDAAHEDPSAFSATLGRAFDLTRLPATARLLAAVVNDQALAASAAKEYFHRKFPVAVADPSNFADWTCDATPRKSADRPLRSYPSGHTTLGYTLGIVLADLIPDKAQAILARAEEYGYSREICGDHYHSDVEAGHALGTAIGLRLLENAALRPDVEAARAELRAAGITK